MTSDTQLPKAFPLLGYETNKYFLLDLDEQLSLEDVKRLAFEIGSKYSLGDCLIVHSSDSKQLSLEIKPLQNYNLIYGKEVPFEYQQKILKELRNSGKIDVKYLEFREKERTSTLRVSPKSQTKGCGEPIAYVKISGENQGIKEYLKMLWIGEQVEKFLRDSNSPKKDKYSRKGVIEHG